MKSCAFTGHRPQNLPFGFREDDERCTALKETLKKQIISLITDENVTHFISGMALGVDMYAAEIVLELKKTYPGITLESAIPCETQAAKWNAAMRERYYGIAAQCDKETLLQTHYTPDCMDKRNRYMVDHADYIIAVWDGKPSGMESTIRRLLAMKKSKLKQNNTVQEIRALKQKLAHKQSLLSGMYVDLKEGLLSQEEYGHHREIIGEDIRALELKLSELESAKMEAEEQITGEMKWKFMIQRYYDATEISADMADAFIESMKLHADGSLEIKLSYMDEFEALTSTCERLRKEVA